MKKRLLAPLITFVVVVSVFFYPFLFQQKLPIPADAIAALYHPYRDYFIKEFPQGYPFKNFLITDPVRQQYPWREISFSAEKKLSLPLWNPYNGAGEPLLANIQSASLYPLNVLLYIFPLPIGWSLLIMLQPLLSCVFLYFYLRNLRLAETASILGAITFAFCGFNSAWLEWNTVVHTALWLPLVLLSIDRLVYLFHDKFNTKFKMQKFYSWSGVFIFSLASSMFAGHLQTFFYVFIFSFIYLLARLWQNIKRWKTFIVFLPLYVLLLFITAIQWLPTLQLISHSARAIDQIWQKDGWFMPYQNLLQFVAPDFFGNPTTLNYWGVWNYAEFIGYIGILPLILVVFALIARADKKTLFFVSLVIISLLFSLPNAIAMLPYHLQIPFISTTQPTRLLFITDFALAVLAALGLDFFLRTQKKVKIFYAIGMVGIVFAGVWFFVTFSSLFALFIEQESIVIAKRNLYIPTFFFIISTMCLSTLWLNLAHKRISKLLNNKILTMLLVCFLIGITAFDLLRFSWKFNTFSEQRLLFPQPATITFLRDQSKNYPWRFLGVDYVADQKRIFAPNLSSHDKLYTLDTYNPLLLKRYQEFAAISEWGFTDIPDFSFNRAILFNNYDSKFIDFLGVKYLTAITDIDSNRFKLLFREGEIRVYENTAVYPRAFMVYDVFEIADKKAIAKKLYDKSTNLRTTAIIEESLPRPIQEKSKVENKVKIISYEENTIKMKVETKKDGFLILTDTFYPTWHVEVNRLETKIYRTNYNFRGVFIPKGIHDVKFYNSLL